MSSIDLVILGIVLEKPQSAYDIQKDVEYHHFSRWTKISVPSIYRILCQKDNVLYDLKDKFIYSNQWIPLSANCTIQEKLRLCSILDEKCSG